MPYKDKEKQKEAIRKAVKRHRVLQKGITGQGITSGITPHVRPAVTPSHPSVTPSVLPNFFSPVKSFNPISVEQQVHRDRPNKGKAIWVSD